MIIHYHLYAYNIYTAYVLLGGKKICDLTVVREEGTFVPGGLAFLRASRLRVESCQITLIILNEAYENVFKKIVI